MDEGQFKGLLDDDPGNPVFAEYAELLINEGRREEALLLCLKGLSHNPTYQLGRLMLARAYYESSMFPFALRELEGLRAEMPQISALKKLVEALCGSMKDYPSNTAAQTDGEVAETEFELEALELIEQDKNKA